MSVVLLVEDEGDVLATLAEALTQRGFEVLTACDGVEALSPGMLDRADIVVTDMRMPRMDGATLYRAARERRPRLPFIFISGHMVDIQSDAGEAGQSRPFLLNKPFSAQVLAEAIQRQITLARGL